MRWREKFRPQACSRRTRDFRERASLESAASRQNAPRENADFHNDFKLIWPVQSPAKKYFCIFCGKSPT
jgi:hypothetical protein